MSFAAPIWLVGLLPWAAVVMFLLWSRRKRVDVPFLDLWPAHGEGVRVRRRTAPPPVALALAILSMLLAIFAAGRPGVKFHRASRPVIAVFDRGYTMSARGTRETRLSELS